tara:strand:+ start:655 stop:891 length:237 start_codon:yes stop_codon:yes gene_type:complete
LKDKEKKFNRGYSYFPNLDRLTSSLVSRLENNAVAMGQLGGDDFLANSTHTVNAISLLKHEISLLIEKKLKQLKQDLK